MILKRKLAEQINLIRNENARRWEWQEITTYEIDEQELKTDIEGAQGELHRVQSLISEYARRMEQANNDVNFTGARDEIQRLSDMEDKLKEKIRGLQTCLGTMRYDRSNRDTPDRPGGNPN